MTNTSGVHQIVRTDDEVFNAFDSLPPRLKQTIRYTVQNWDPVQLREALDAGHPEEAVIYAVKMVERNLPWPK